MSMLSDKFLLFIHEFWGVLVQMSPYLLFGFLVAGLLAMLISAKLVERHLGGRGFWPVFKAAMLGVPLPLCSCGVIPVAASLHRHGASRAATSAFLISTPQTGVDSIMVTFSLMGPVLAIFRPVAALIAGLWGGALVLFFGENGNGESHERVLCTDECCSVTSGSSKLVRGFKYSLFTLPADIGRSLLVGLVIAGLITAFLPASLFSVYLGNPILEYLTMMAVGIPLYVCATASVPVAAALILKGVSPGAAMVFLMTGPATNAAAIATIWKIMGRRTALLYLLAVATSAIAAGVVLDLFFKVQVTSSITHVHEMLPEWVGISSAIVLLALLSFGIWRSFTHKHAEDIDHEEDESLTLSIEGMTCSHCVESVQAALLERPGVHHAVVTLHPPRAVITGDDLDREGLTQAVEEAGFRVTAIE